MHFGSFCAYRHINGEDYVKQVKELKATICELKTQIDNIMMESFEIVAKMQCFQGELANMDEKLNVAKCQDPRTPARTYQAFTEESPCTPVVNARLDDTPLKPSRKNG